MTQRTRAGVRAAVFIVIVVAFVVVSGCSGAGDLPLGEELPGSAALAPAELAPGTGGAGSLFVVDPLAHAVFRFRASDAGSDVVPRAVIQGPATQLTSPTQLALDTMRNRLYVLDTFRVLVFDAPTSLRGDVAPARVITFVTPGAQSLALDRLRDVLYVGHGSGGGITSYDNASALAGRVTPIRLVAGAATGLVSPLGLLADASDRLWVTDLAGDMLTSFESASTRTGDSAPDRCIRGPRTGFVDPFGLCFDGAGMLIVGDNGNDALAAFPGAALATGDIEPAARQLPVTTTLVDPRQAVCEDGVSAVIADGVSGSVKTYLTAGLQTGAAVPVRVLLAPTAGLQLLTGVAVDSTR